MSPGYKARGQADTQEDRLTCTVQSTHYQMCLGIIWLASFYFRVHYNLKHLTARMVNEILLLTGSFYLCAGFVLAHGACGENWLYRSTRLQEDRVAHSQEGERGGGRGGRASFGRRMVERFLFRGGRGGGVLPESWGAGDRQWLGGVHWEVTPQEKASAVGYYRKAWGYSSVIP